MHSASELLYRRQGGLAVLLGVAHRPVVTVVEAEVVLLHAVGEVELQLDAQDVLQLLLELPEVELDQAGVQSTADPVARSARTAPCARILPADVSDAPK